MDILTILWTLNAFAREFIAQKRRKVGWMNDINNRLREEREANKTVILEEVDHLWFRNRFVSSFVSVESFWQSMYVYWKKKNIPESGYIREKALPKDTMIPKGMRKKKDDKAIYPFKLPFRRTAGWE